MKFMRTLLAALALAFSLPAHAAPPSLGSVQTGGGNWPTVLAPDINDDFTKIYGTPFLTIGAQTVFGTERALAVGSLLSLTDGGAGGNATIAVSDAETLCLGGLTSAADKVPYFTGSGTCALADFTSAIRTLITTPTSASLRSLLNDEIGGGALVFLGTPADDQVPVGDSASATTWRTIPDSDGATQKLQYDQATNSWIAGTDDDVPEAGDFSNLGATAPITQSGGNISTSIATGRLVGRTTAGSGVMEQITPDATLALTAGALGVIDVTCIGCLGATEIAGLDAGDTTTGTFGDARVDGSLEADELVLSGDVDGTANANDIDEVAVESELEGVLDLADLQGDLPLGTKTSGNYAAGDAEAGAALTGDSATGFFPSGTLEDARVDGSLEADELVLAGDVDGTANSNDLDEVAVESELESVLDLPDLQGDLPLGTKTSGNFVGTVAAGAGVAVTGADAESATKTVAFDYSAAGSDPALGAGQCRFTVDGSSNSQIVCEGATANTFETRFSITDPTADRLITIPDGDAVAVRPNNGCPSTDKVNGINNDGTVTCGTDLGGAGSGDNITVNGVAAADVDFDDATPSNPAGGWNIAWQKDSGTPNNVSAYVPAILGKKTIAIPSGAIKSRTSNGCASGAFSGTNIEVSTCDFDAATDERAQFTIAMPKSADESAGLEAQFVWTSASGSGNVIWTMACVAVSDDDPVDGSLGTVQSVTDGITAANDQMVSSYTSAITPGGTWTEGDTLYCQVTRDADNGSDTAAGDARLLAVRILYSINVLRDN
jgi:hypothetical protein